MPSHFLWVMSGEAGSYFFGDGKVIIVVAVTFVRGYYVLCPAEYFHNFKNTKLRVFFAFIVTHSKCATTLFEAPKIGKCLVGCYYVERD